MERPVILDIGSRSTKVGFSSLQSNCPDIVVDSREALQMQQADVDVHSVSNETDDDIMRWQWDQCERIAVDALGKLMKICSPDHPLLVIERPGLEAEVRQRWPEFAFEGLDVPTFYLASDPVMTLYSVGLTSGIVLSSGHVSSSVSTVHDGHRVPHGLVDLRFGGKDVTKRAQMLIKSGLERDIGAREAEEIKCKYGNLMIHDETFTSNATDLKVIGKQIGDLLFSPGRSCHGFHKAIERSIYCTDEEHDYEPVYFRNIVLSGGNTLFPGIKERLERDVKPPEYLSCGVRVIAAPFRQHAGWIGGSIAAALPTFKHAWITKEEYQEYGKNILHRKCLSY